jgi:hypothetical protein
MRVNILLIFVLFFILLKKIKINFFSVDIPQIHKLFKLILFFSTKKRTISLFSAHFNIIIAFYNIYIFTISS